MNDTPDNEKLPKSPQKPGLFARLFGTAASADGLQIAVAPIIDANGDDHARHIAQPFQNLDGVRIKMVREEPILKPDADRADLLPAACGQALGWLGSMGVDLVLWGDIPAPGTTYYIYFAAAPPVDADPAGTVSPFQALTLPVGFDPDMLGGLLAAVALAAMTVEGEKKTSLRRQLVAPVLERAAQDIERIPADFTMREQASVHAAFANALAAFGHLFPGGEVYHRATQSYAQAIKGTLRSESPSNWAYLQRNLGTVLQALGERGDDVDTLEQAAAAYRAALEVFSFEATPFPWATTQIRLGQVLYRLDINSGETAGLKLALSHYQAALKVLNRKSTPLLWSETLNNLGQAAQVLGREIGNREVIERAIAACEQALIVRTRETHPTLWASTQNNMGSALFLLGRMSSDEKYFQDALAAFMGAREVYEQMGLTRMVEITDKNIQHAQARLPDENGTDAGPSDPAMWWMEEGEDDET